MSTIVTLNAIFSCVCQCEREKSHNALLYTQRKLLTNWICWAHNKSKCSWCKLFVFAVAKAFDTQSLVEMFDSWTLTGAHTLTLTLAPAHTNQASHSTVDSFTHRTQLECRIFGAFGIKRDKTNTHNHFAQYFRYFSEQRRNTQNQNSLCPTSFCI